MMNRRGLRTESRGIPQEEEQVREKENELLHLTRKDRDENVNQFNRAE